MRRTLARAALLLCALPATLHAAPNFPVAAAGTEGLDLRVASTGDVTLEFLGASGVTLEDVYLHNPPGTNDRDNVIFSSTSVPGSTSDLGTLTAGTEIVFRLHVTGTDLDVFSGPAALQLNADRHAHARVQGGFGAPTVSLVSFDVNGPTAASDFSDFSLSVTNTVAVPEPSTLTLLLAGLVLPLALRRRA